MKKYWDLLQICQSFLDFHLSSIKLCIKSYITIRFTASFKTMIINFELYSGCKVCWFTFGIVVIILIGCFVFKCLWGLKKKRNHGDQGRNPYKGLHFTCVLHVLVY